ncbi:MAG: hypothetical protein KDK53_03155 [Maritimibacter sp.]|nr:hypothetical protein [Maritimibacter sp.]
MDRQKNSPKSELSVFGAVTDQDLSAFDVGYAVSEFLHYDGRPFYPVGALSKARVMRVWLGTGKGLVTPQPDLIFEMPPFEGQPADFRLFEIVLRTTWGAVYGGWAFGTDLKLAADFWSGHRVLHTQYRGERLQFTYDLPSGRYQYCASECVWLSTAEIRSMAKARQRA